MARISISLPDKLMGRLDPIKESINVSQICREALELRVTAYERAANRNGQDLDVKGLVRRLREERELVRGKFEQLAKSNANAWLGAASYLEIKSAVANGNHDLRKYKLPRAAFGMMKQDMEELKMGCDGPQAVLYKTAWLDSVKAVWTEIAGQLEEQDSQQPVEQTE